MRIDTAELREFAREDCEVSTQKNYILKIADMIDLIQSEQPTLPNPLFTRTVYSVGELHAQIDAIEALGFTNYDFKRDVEEREVFVPCQPNDKVYRARWIIKVYGEVTE